MSIPNGRRTTYPFRSILSSRRTVNTNPFRSSLCRRKTPIFSGLASVGEEHLSFQVYPTWAKHAPILSGLSSLGEEYLSFFVREEHLSFKVYPLWEKNT